MKSKIINSSFILLLTMMMLSCTTVENIFTFKRENGQALFLRPVTYENKKKDLVLEMSFDMTIEITTETEYKKNPVVNYTVTLEKENKKEASKVDIAFIADGQEIILENKNLIYKEIDQFQHYVERYTTEMKIDDFKKMLDSSTPVKIVIKYPDGKQIVFTSKDFEAKLADLRIVLL